MNNEITNTHIINMSGFTLKHKHIKGTVCSSRFIFHIQATFDWKQENAEFLSSEYQSLYITTFTVLERAHALAATERTRSINPE